MLAKRQTPARTFRVAAFSTKRGGDYCSQGKFSEIFFTDYNITFMKPPISYYGGKQKLASTIIKLIPEHQTYTEAFIGGGAVFWNKEPSQLETINDTNGELINFYEQVKNNFATLETHIRISLHSRDMHRRATVIYNNPDMFDKTQRAWAVWVSANQSFASKLNDTWGCTNKSNSLGKKITNCRANFTEDMAIRMQNVQIECTDALRIITSRDTKDTFHYVDPPYYNSDMGHYDGYTVEDFTRLLEVLSTIKGKFLLSSYPSPVLKQFTESNGWQTLSLDMKTSVNNTGKGGKKGKTEVLTANYPIHGIFN